MARQQRKPKRLARVARHLHHIGDGQLHGGSWARRQAARRSNNRQKHNGRLGNYLSR